MVQEGQAPAALHHHRMPVGKVDHLTHQAEAAPRELASAAVTEEDHLQPQAERAVPARLWHERELEREVPREPQSTRTVTVSLAESDEKRIR